MYGNLQLGYFHCPHTLWVPLCTAQQLPLYHPRPAQSRRESRSMDLAPVDWHSTVPDSFLSNSSPPLPPSCSFTTSPLLPFQPRNPPSPPSKPFHPFASIPCLPLISTTTILPHPRLARAYLPRSHFPQIKESSRDSQLPHARHCRRSDEERTSQRTCHPIESLISPSRLRASRFIRPTPLSNSLGRISRALFRVSVRPSFPCAGLVASFPSALSCRAP